MCTLHAPQLIIGKIIFRPRQAGSPTSVHNALVFEFWRLTKLCSFYRSDLWLQLVCVCVRYDLIQFEINQKHEHVIAEEKLIMPNEWMYTLSWHWDVTKSALNQFAIAIHTVPSERFPRRPIRLIQSLASWVNGNASERGSDTVSVQLWIVFKKTKKRKQRTKLNWILCKSFVIVACPSRPINWHRKLHRFLNTIITWIYYYLLSLMKLAESESGISMIYWQIPPILSATPIELDVWLLGSSLSLHLSPFVSFALFIENSSANSRVPRPLFDNRTHTHTAHTMRKK